MAFNYEQFKRQFKEAAQSRGIDPARGASEFQACLIRAEINADLHHSRMRELVRAAAARQVEQARRGAKWEEGRGLLTEDRKAIDESLATEAESATWWWKLSDGDWKSGGGSYAESQATPIRLNARNVKAARFKAAGAMMHEVLEENPTQAEMKAKRSQKEIV